jgi:DNA invertase Pin-like site-specific DNA recombinase
MGWSTGLADAAVTAGQQLHAAIYDRVSKDPTGRQRSVEKQEASNRRVCVGNGWLLTEDDVYTDNDRSASRFATKKRPNWDRLRDAVADSRYHVVVLWEVSRGDRDDLGWLGFLHLCRQLGVWIHIESHRHTYDPRKRRDYKTLAEEGLDSADESERISERIRGDVEANARRGMPHGVVTYGYRREYEVDGSGQRRIAGQFADDQTHVAAGQNGETEEYTHAGVVREIYRRLLAGEPIRAVVADLNVRGIPSPRGSARGWTPTTVRGVAVNPAYAGQRALNGVAVAAAKWPGLVSEADHHSLVGRLNDPARRTTRDTAIKHLGSGLFVCGVCGRKVRTVSQYYGRAYTCWPDKLVGRSPRAERREVTAAEVQGLRGLDVRGQAAGFVDLFEAGVSLASIARGLGLNRSTVSMRVQAERRRRGSRPVTRPRPAGEGFHVSRAADDVDAYVQLAMWRRLAREDVAEVLAEDARADERMAALAAEIAEKQARLDAARDGYAREGVPSLDTLNRVAATLEPEIARARARMNEARVGPVLEGLVLPTAGEVEAEWWRRSLPQRREVIRVLVERVEILPVRGRGRAGQVESVRIVWLRPRRGGDRKIAG